MSVIAFSPTLTVWGASSTLIYDVILFCIKEAGEKPYLLKFREQYDHGYRSLDVGDLTSDETAELRALIHSYISGRRYEPIVQDSENYETVRGLVERLLEMLDAYIAGRALSPH